MYSTLFVYIPIVIRFFYISNLIGLTKCIYIKYSIFWKFYTNRKLKLFIFRIQFVRIRAVSLQAMSTWISSKRTRSVKTWMAKAGGLTMSWSNDGSGVSSTRKHIWLNTTISEKQGRLLGNMCIHTTLNVVIPHSIIRHQHPAIIQSCYWMIAQPRGEFSPLPSYIYQFIIKCLDFCLDNWTTIFECEFSQEVHTLCTYDYSWHRFREWRNNSWWNRWNSPFFQSK